MNIYIYNTYIRINIYTYNYIYTIIYTYMHIHIYIISDFQNSISNINNPEPLRDQSTWRIVRTLRGANIAALLRSCKRPHVGRHQPRQWMQWTSDITDNLRISVWNRSKKKAAKHDETMPWEVRGNPIFLHRAYHIYKYVYIYIYIYIYM